MKYSFSLTHSSYCPVVDKLTSTEGKVLEGEILQLFLARLKAIIGKEHYCSIVPARHIGRIVQQKKSALSALKSLSIELSTGVLIKSVNVKSNLSNSCSQLLPC